MRRAGAWVAFWTAPGLVACGGGGRERQVTVSAVQTFWSTTGIVGQETAPLDDVVIVQADGAGGARRMVAAAQPDGSWKASVPPGPYWAEVRRHGATIPDQYEVASGGDVLDLGIEWEALRPAPSVATSVDFQLQGLQPWEAGDRLSVYGWDTDVTHIADPGLVPGVTQGTWSVPWLDTLGGMLQALDVLRISQFRRSAANDGGQVVRLIASATVSGLAMEDGVPLQATVPALAAPAATLDLALDLRAGAFAAALQPDAAHLTTSVSVNAKPLPGYVFGHPLSLLWVEPVAPVDHDFGTFSVGLPVPASWSVFGTVGVQGVVTRTIPGSTQSLAFRTEITRALDFGGSAPITPLVTPVRDLRVAGRDASVAVTGAGTSPRLTWTAPATGAQPRYTVSVGEMVSGANAATYRLVCLAFVKGTSVYLPAGALEAGKTYVVGVAAHTGGGDYGTARWWRAGLGTGGGAFLLSATIQP